MQTYPWKHAWITGGSSGIGRELAIVLNKAGVKVSVSARSVDALDALVAEHDGIYGYPLDVTDENATAQTVTAIETERGPIDLAVLNAGFWELSDSNGLDLEMFRKSMDVNFMGVANCMVALVAAMSGRGCGHVGVVASVAGYRGLPRSAYYGPTKAALNNLCESLQPDLRRMGLKLQVINPGFVRTPMTDRNDFPMPFLMEPPAATAQILKGLTSERFEIAFPWQLVAILKFARVLPISLFLWLIKTFVARA